MEAALTLVSCADKDEATRLATALVEAKLAGCVTLINQAESIYRWQGKIEHDQEVLLLIKHPQQNFPELEKAITQLHSYDTPEILQLPITQGSASYLSWLGDSCHINTQE